MILRIRYPVSGEVNDVRLAVTLPVLTRISTSPSGSTSADTVSAKAPDIDDTAARAATTTATATATGLRLMPSGCAADADTAAPKRPADGGTNKSSRGSEKRATATKPGNRPAITTTTMTNDNLN